MKQIFPKEIIESTIDVHQFRHTKKNKVIYGILTLILIIILIVLPFIKTTIYTTSQGFIRSEKERVAIQSMSGGEILYQNIQNNLQVIKGDTLLVVNNTAISKKINNDVLLQDEVEMFVEDINKLLQGKESGFQTAKLRQEYLAYQQKLQELQTKKQKFSVDYHRNKKLYEKGVVAKTTLENVELEYQLAKNAVYQYKKQQKSNWQNQLVQFNNQLKELENTIENLERTNALSIIKAPVTGTLFTNVGIEKGGFLNSGASIGEISPKANLLVSCYISPSDIGLLQKGKNVNFQVSAFNYNQWGLAKGKILEIANDVEVINNKPVFRVLCSLDQKYLTLKNGFKGHLKKGMVLNARFELIERSLFDLLYDKMDDWLNPSTQSAKVN
ncbi:membrane fusion protein, peptide pheromone/bacteriocin exporter [Tenacibaculum sp. 190524A02b]|uniref:Membrane fusion protein, peptide pheromone/bacteriocin exporter n=1 Tax=Tenacibaculum vairaonense TaxID=3137860 RepID=A0ABM9PK22_9FLAO